MRATNSARADEAVDFNELQESPEIRFAVEDAEARYELLDELVQARKDSKLKQTDVAAAMSSSQSTVSEFENGSADPHLSTVQRYARAVGKRVVVRVESEVDCQTRIFGDSDIHTFPVKVLDMKFASSYASAAKRSDFAKAA